MDLSIAGYSYMRAANLRENKMNESNLEFKDFIEKPEETSESEEQAQELDVQKMVVADLAAEKAELSEKFSRLMGEFLQLKKTAQSDAEELLSLKSALASANEELGKAKNELSALQAKQMDLQERNPNFIALLDRDVELPDRFPGETRDHVLEVIAEARETAEKEGRIRRAQILESVLVANEPNGTLAERRNSLKKLFSDNCNILNGTVLEELSRLDIPHKAGDDYLFPEEILKRTY